MVSGGLRIGVLVVVALLALMAGGCGGKKKKKEDPVATAVATPGVRTLVIPKQRNAITVVVPPCTAAAVQQTGAKRKPPGSNEVVVPEGTLTQTVAVPPCPEKPAEGGTANTILIAPGGAGAVQQGAEAEMAPQNELVLPTNSNVRTIIVPPCTISSTEKKKKGTKSLAFEASKSARSVTAPPCTAPPPMKKK